jgi:glycogen operon protein
LHDLVSYNDKHNLANEENNRDGTDANWSWNSGAEGETDNIKISDNRYRRSKGLMASLLLSFGTPMILACDEFLRTQLGNNNAYCQDNIISWFAWEGIDRKDKAFAKFTKKVIALRKSLKIFNRNDFFSGKICFDDHKDLTWYAENGSEFDDNEWLDFTRKSFAYCVYDGNRFILCIMNADFNDIDWRLPNCDKAQKWKLHLDTSGKFLIPEDIKPAGTIKVPAWSVLVFEINK